MGKRVFVSYDFNDKKPRKTVVKWLENNGFEVIAVKEEELETEPDVQGQQRLKKQISNCSALLVLVGDNTHNRPWVNFEVKMATSQKKKVEWVRIPDRKGGPPHEIKRKPPVSYSEDAIVNALR